MGGEELPREKSNTERINVFLPKDKLAQIQREADERGMSVSGLVRMIIMEWLSARDKK